MVATLKSTKVWLWTIRAIGLEACVSPKEIQHELRFSHARRTLNNQEFVAKPKGSAMLQPLVDDLVRLSGARRLCDMKPDARNLPFQ
jgi:hypothetical protein